MNDFEIASAFAQRNGYKVPVKRIGKWNDQTAVYIIPHDHKQPDEPEKQPDTIGLPVFVLVNKGKARFATPDETPRIMAKWNA